MNIELRHLRYFIAIVELGNFSRAAEQLHISQPGLSAQIKQLEKSLDTHLFDRIGRRIVITESGTLLLQYARKIISDLAEAKQAIGELQGLVRGKLTVGVVQTVNASLIPQISSLFLLKYPGISLHISELPDPEIEHGVDTGKLAVGISSIPVRTESLDCDKLFSEKLVAAVSKSHRLANKKSISTAQLAGESFVTFPQGFLTRKLIEQLFQAADINPRISFEANTIASILTATANTDLVTIVPELALRLKEGKDLCPIKIKDAAAKRTVGLLWRHGIHRRKAAVAFAEIVRSVISKINSGQR